jgi:DNA-binding GntR family transcriptional regulator
MGQKVADKLRQWILSGRLPGGETIRQEEIAQELGVSRLPVREALSILESEGLVIRESFKSTIVAEVSLDGVKETYALRVLLETYLLEHAIPNITEQDLDRLNEIVTKSNHCDSEDEWVQLNLEFHLALYAPANLPFTLQTLEQVIRRADRYSRIQRALSPTLRDSSGKQHLEIINQIRAHNPHGAIEALKRHIDWNSEEISDVILKSHEAEQA